MPEIPVGGVSRTLSMGGGGGSDAEGQRSRDSSQAVGTTSIVIYGANPARTEAFLVNDSLNTIYIGLGETAVVNKGIRLNPSGGSFELNAINLWYGSISAIATAASSNLCAVEVEKVAGMQSKPR